MLLEEYKRAYKKTANNLENWEHINKNKLCNLYIENENNKTVAGYYLSAIIYKYWYLIDKFYRLSPNVVTPEDVYEWLIDSILYALEHRMWLNPESSIYNDTNGPDKVINRCMACRRFTFYQSINRKKRKDGFGTVSIDEMMEEYNDSLDAIGDTSVVETFTDVDSDLTLKNYIKERFIKGDYMGAFFADIISFTGDVFVINPKTNRYVLSKEKVANFFRDPGNHYTELFAKRYGVPLKEVNNQWKLWKGSSQERIEEELGSQLYILSKTPYIDNYGKTNHLEFKYPSDKGENQDKYIVREELF